MQCLVGFEVSVLRGLDILRKALDEVATVGELLAASSIIRSSKKSMGGDDSETYLYAVAKIVTTTESSMVLRNLMKIEEKLEKEFYAIHLKTFLLSYSNQLSLNPQLLLPHPMLVKNNSFLVGSTEVWGQYLHPVLNKNLSEISQNIDVKEVEFIAQGKVILRPQHRTFVQTE